MNPVFQDRDNVEKMVANPKYYEKPLRELSQHLTNVIMPVKRLTSYYANILTWDYFLIPYVDFKTMGTTAFTKATDRVYDYLESLNVKKSFRELMMGCVKDILQFPS